MPPPIRILLVDDHRMFAEAMELLLAGYEGIEVVGTVATGEEAVERCGREKPDVVLVDVDLPGIDGIETTRRLRESCPTAQIVIVTSAQDRDVVGLAIEAGASGFVRKSQAADELVDVVRWAAAGEIILPAGQIERILARVQHGRLARSQATRRLDLLTSREIQILQAVAEGKNVLQIAKDLFISPSTVQTHLKNVLSKLEVHSKLEAVMLALRHGLLRLSASP